MTGSVTATAVPSAVDVSLGRTASARSSGPRRLFGTPTKVPKASGLMRAWLMDSAHLSEARVGEVLKELAVAEVDTLADLYMYSKTPRFDARLSEMSAIKIRSALDAHARRVGAQQAAVE